MKKRSLLFIPIAILILSCMNGCKRENRNSSNVSSQDVLSISTLNINEVFLKAGNELFDMYKDNINKDVHSYFEVTKKFYIFDTVRIDVTWELKVIKGSEEGVKLINSKDRDNYQGVYIGYYDNLIEGDTEFELIPTLDYKGTTRKVSDVLGEEKKFTYKVNKLELSTYDDYISLCEEAGSLLDNKNYTCLINATVLSVSIDGKNIFLHDEENNGILAYETSYSKNDFHSGDYVSLIGDCYLDGGSYFIYNPKINLISRAKPSYQKPDYVDVTSIFNDDDFMNKIVKYQNTRILINNVVFDSVVDGKYYISINNNRYEIISDLNFFLSSQENETLFRNFELNRISSVKGILKCIEGKYVIIPDAIDAF